MNGYSRRLNGVHARVFRSFGQVVSRWSPVRPEERPYLAWLAAVMLLAVLVRCAWIAQFLRVFRSGYAEVPYWSFTRWDPVHYDELAMRLANGEGYVDAGGNPTAYRPVGYPAFLAGLYATFGRSIWVIGLANTALWMGVAGMTYVLARYALSPSAVRSLRRLWWRFCPRISRSIPRSRGASRSTPFCSWPRWWWRRRSCGGRVGG